MATSTSDWYQTTILSPNFLSKSHSSISSIPHNVFFITHSPSFIHHKLTILNSSKSSSPLLIETPSNTQTNQQSPISNPDISNKDIRVLCNDPKTQPLAFEYYQKAKQQSGFRPDSLTLNLLIASLIKSKQWASLSALSKDFEAFDVFPSKSSCVRLINACFRARKLKTVESLLGVFQSKEEISVLAFGSAMSGYNNLHMYRSTLSVFDRMRTVGLFPDARCYLSIIDAHRKLRNAEEVLALFREFESRNIDTSPQLSAHIYLLLCDCLGRSGRAFEAMRYFREMVEKGLPPNPLFYAALISSFAGIREAEIAEDLFREARAKGMLKDPTVFLKLVLMYVELGSVEKTIAVVTVMKESRIRVSDCIQCAVVNGYAAKRGLRASVKAYEELKSLNCVPGQVTYASLINVYCRLGLSTKAEAMFSEMVEKGYDRCVVAYSNMISMYGKIGRTRDAMKLLAKMKQKGCEPNVWVYNSLLDMHGRLVDLRQVEKLWNEMKRRAIAPDKISYSSVISAYGKAKEFEECLKLYQEFKMSGGKVDRILAGIMVGVYSKSNRIEELMKLLRDMKMEGTELDERLYKSSLNAFRDSGLQVHVKWLEENFKSKQSEARLGARLT